MRRMRLMCKCDMIHSYVWHDSFISVTWLIHMCDMTHSYVRHDLFIMTWHVCIHMCAVTHSYVGHDSVTCVLRDAFICVTWLSHVCVLDFKPEPKPKPKPKPRIWHRASSGMTFSLMTLHFHMYDMAHSYGSHGPFVSVTCLVAAQWWRWKQFHCTSRMLSREMCRCDMTHSYAWHDSSVYVTWAADTMCTRNTTRSCVCYAQFECWSVCCSECCSECCSACCSALCPIYMCDMHDSSVWHDQVIYVTCLIATQRRRC